MEDNQNERQPNYNLFRHIHFSRCDLYFDCTAKIEDDENGRQSKWKTTKMEDNQNGRRPTLKMIKIEDDQN